MSRRVRVHVGSRYGSRIVDVVSPRTLGGESNWKADNREPAVRSEQEALTSLAVHPELPTIAPNRFTLYRVVPAPLSLPAPDRQWGSYPAVRSAQEAVIHAARVHIPSCDRPRVVDVVGDGALARTCARAGTSNLMM